MLTTLWLSQLSIGLAGPEISTHLRQERTLMSSPNRLVAFEQQPPIRSTAKQAISTVYNPAARQQELGACEGGGAWCGMHTWGSRLWQWLGWSQREPTYRWQEKEEGDAYELEQDDRGLGGGVVKRRLREATIPHIIHQVLTLAVSTGSGSCFLLHGMLYLFKVFGTVEDAQGVGRSSANLVCNV